MRKHKSIYQVLIGITFPMLLFCFILCSPQPAVASYCGPEDDMIYEGPWVPSGPSVLLDCPNSTEECYFWIRKVWFVATCYPDDDHDEDFAEPLADCDGTTIKTYYDGNCNSPLAVVADEFYEWDLDQSQTCTQSPDYCLCLGADKGYVAGETINCPPS